MENVVQGTERSKISFSHVGDDEMLQDDFYLSLRLDKWGASGSRWKEVKVKGGSAINSQIYENIDLDYAGSYESDGREKGKISKNRFELSRCINS